MRFLPLILIIVLHALIGSCSPDKANEVDSNSEPILQLEIEDSVIVDYLGAPVLCDFSPNQEHMLFFNSRNREFIITNLAGKILSQFEKEGDIPDNPGMLADKPIFYDNLTVIARGRKGVFAYDFNGENVWKIPLEENSNLWTRRLFKRSIYKLPSSNVFTVVNYDKLNLNPSNDSLYENHHILKIIDKEEQKSNPIIPLEPFSRFLNGKGYPALSMLPTIHLKRNELLVSYDRDELLYLYEFKNSSFQLKDTFSLEISTFYLDEVKERDAYKDIPRFFISENVFQGVIKGAWLLDNDLILVRYNIGIKESERLEPKIEKTGMNELRNTNLNKWPPDEFQLYKNGKKYGQSFESRVGFAQVAHVKDNTIWFEKDNEALGVEDNYAVFYKTKLVPKK
jgi:hypothetical protein